MDIEEFVKVLSRLVAYESTDENKKELKNCANYIARYFKDTKVYVKRFNSKGIPSLLISLKKTAQIIASCARFL